MANLLLLSLLRDSRLLLGKTGILALRVEVRLFLVALKCWLISWISLSKYSIPWVAELLGIGFQGDKYILCYTPNSHHAAQLFKVLTQYVIDHLTERITFLGDFN